MSHPYRTPASEPESPAPRDTRAALVLDAEIVLLIISTIGVVHGCRQGFTAVDGAAFAAFLFSAREIVRAVWRRYRVAPG